ncbi:MAG: NAD-dependent deacetylase [Myxococcales bacterium]|nr:NAD-dependent deacetylase [Myxococcales bacterium]
MASEQENWARFREVIEDAGDGLILFGTGAGISKASGIPTFRGDEDALWEINPQILGTYAYFEETPKGHWEWFLMRLRAYYNCQPNPAHYAMAALESWQRKRGGKMGVITQNVDLLHDRAGTRELIHIHGDMGHVRCSRYGCKLGAPYGKIPYEDVDFSAFEKEPSDDNVPRCPSCGSLLRIHALLFDEYYSSHVDYRMQDALNWIREAKVMIFVGTSFSVGITSSMVEGALKNKIPIFSLNPANEEDALFEAGWTNLSVKAEEALPRLCEELGIEIPSVASAL